ncbi:GLYATL3 [Branchiostoma lanceolatum]|uniref:Glycine N-acyltransferase-like protein n=1 Tax=Branchiostoma lanceolatum TaxID=7740 RepID=A0A8J9W565_BRALA|nr:GLYATL3 [Branchiostoma lanceolatum]
MMSCQRLSSRALQELVDTFRLRRNLAVGPSTAKIFYTARNYLAGKIPGELVFAVDKWPDFSAVMCAVGEGTYQYLQDIETYTFYWENNQGLLRLLRDAKFVDWDETFTIAGFSERGLPLLNQVCHDMNKPPPTNDTMTHCNTAFFTGQIIGNDSPPSPLLTIGPLEVQHAELVNRVWRWGGQSKVLEFLQYLIRTFPSRCLYDENDQPLSFSVAQPWAIYGASLLGVAIILIRVNLKFSSD